MINTPPPEDFEQQAQRLLRGSADAMDGATRTRLARARAAAVDAAGSRRAWTARYLVPAGAAATAVLATLIFIGRGPPPQNVNDTGGAALYDLELLADADAWELGEEADLEFIEWAAAMAEQEAAGG